MIAGVGDRTIVNLGGGRPGWPVEGQWKRLEGCLFSAFSLLASNS